VFKIHNPQASNTSLGNAKNWHYLCTFTN